MGSFWVRLLAGVAVLLVVVVSGVFGATLFWSPAFVAWACLYVAIGVLAEAWLRWRERARGWDVADRPVLQRPVGWSIALVVMAALAGTGNTHLTSLAPGLAVFFIVIPYAWRERRRAAARKRAEGVAGSSGEGDAV
ncbi:hypothetical protein [Actinomadura latina]|uniref:Uncharacterized protein n=1 Tax=Actinomadura latina TaxID=163603 RepID=A0A846Z4L2_9ACTN|nr:hypothetical protein [Actinomadura latina]NKZ05605.1 hypothetical protein [Actinomadura latina]